AEVPVLGAEQGGEAEEDAVVAFQDVGGMHQRGRNRGRVQNGTDFRAFQALRPQVGQLVDGQSNSMFARHVGSPVFRLKVIGSAAGNAVITTLRELPVRDRTRGPARGFTTSAP